MPGYQTGWWRFRSKEELKSFQLALNDRGLRERELKRFLEKHTNIIEHCSQKVTVNWYFCRFNLVISIVFVSLIRFRVVFPVGCQCFILK